MGFLDNIMSKLPFGKKEDDLNLDLPSDNNTNLNENQGNQESLNFNNPLNQNPLNEPNPLETQNQFPSPSTNQNNTLSQPNYPHPSEIFQNTVNQGFGNQSISQGNELAIILAKLEAIEAYLKSIDNRLNTIEMLLRQRFNNPYY